MQKLNFKKLVRSSRASIYRLLPRGQWIWHFKRLAGYERRWDLEGLGFTKAGFIEILKYRVLKKISPGLFLEFQAGDGLVGSLGVWLETIPGWRTQAWEHRPTPLQRLRENRPLAEIIEGRLTMSSCAMRLRNPVGISARGCQEASVICKAIRNKIIRPKLVSIGTPAGGRFGNKGFMRQVIAFSSFTTEWSFF